VTDADAQDLAPGLYVHVPLCTAVCPYCDFAVVKDRGPRKSDFVRGLLAEIELVEEPWSGIDTIYFGGGTPSALAIADLETILDAVRSKLGIAASARIFFEANPEDVDRERARAWRSLGIDTLSLGVQSFDDQELAFLGRRHRAPEALRAFEVALATGFDSVSIDLIYGLPRQTLASWRAALARTAALGSQHVSAYQLTVKEGTAFARRRDTHRLVEQDMEAQADLFRATHDVLGEAGLEGYEASNFARAPRYRSDHNMKYWRHAPYLGLGPSAHSFRDRRRWWNERELAAWNAAVALRRRPVAGCEALSVKDVALEALMLGLRTADGLDLGRLDRELGTRIVERNAARLAQWAASDLVELRGDRLRPTTRGMALADELAAQLTLGH
jgi:oxygen-independent coproporphyrinogen III oxidase